MYRLVFYGLIFLLAVALILSFFGMLPFSPLSLLFSTLVLIGISGATNTLFAAVYQAPTNLESVYISALILALIITPISSPAGLPFLGWAAVLSMASKYILNLGYKHLFNPVALSVALTAIAINQSASWWVGTAVMLPFVLLIGFLIVYKIRRFDLVISFTVISILSTLILGFFNHQNPFGLLIKIIFESSIFFFAAIMLTEPLTTPPSRSLRLLYAGLVGFLFAPQLHLGSIYLSPELALIAGNIFSYMVSPKTKLILHLRDRIQLTPDTYDFIFTPDSPIHYHPGQYMEWTLEHSQTDTRGSRRYFTLASSPTEPDLRLGIKFNPNSSSFKQSLLSLNAQTSIVASQIAGEFTLPSDPAQKLVFIAGGIGITPFRSMIKYLLDTNQKRDIVLFYSVKTAAEIVYRDVFDAASEKLGLKVIYYISDISGRLSDLTIKDQVPDYQSRHYYLSGPHSLVLGLDTVLLNLGVPRSHIKTDYFPGFA